MTAIDRTAYPNLDKALTREELAARHTLSEADREFISINTRGVAGRLMLAILLSVRRDVGYFPTLGETHASVISHIAAQLELEVTERRPDFSEKTLYRYRAAVRDFLDIHAYGREGEGLVSAAIINAAATMSDPADLINRALQALAAAGIDLPAFSTLDRLAGHLRTQVHSQMYDGPVTVLFRSLAHISTPLCVQKPMGFSIPMLSDDDVDYRTH